MAVALEGGCRVTRWNEGEPVQSGPLRVFPQIGRAFGAQAISMRILELAPGTSPEIRNAQCDEVLYVVEGEGSILLDRFPNPVGPDTGFYLPPGSTFSVQNPGPNRLLLVSCRCPEPDEVLTTPLPVGQACPAPAPSFVEGLGAAPRLRFATLGASGRAMVRLSDRKPESTADRWYRVLIDDEVGSAQVTQFVGGIPPGRAPDHFHLYEEVLFILAGTGRMWAGRSSAPIGAGSCVYLPRRQMHCVENTGAGELRLLGVFYPAGSPAVRYDSGPAAPTNAAS